MPTELSLYMRNLIKIEELQLSVFADQFLVSFKILFQLQGNVDNGIYLQVIVPFCNYACSKDAINDSNSYVLHVLKLSFIRLHFHIIGTNFTFPPAQCSIFCNSAHFF